MAIEKAGIGIGVYVTMFGLRLCLYCDIIQDVNLDAFDGDRMRFAGILPPHRLIPLSLSG